MTYNQQNQNNRVIQGNTGILFNNRNSKTSDKAPDVTGSLQIEGVEYRIAGWDRKSPDGKAYLRLVATPKQQGQPTQQQGQQAQNSGAPF